MDTGPLAIQLDDSEDEFSSLPTSRGELAPGMEAHPMDALEVGDTDMFDMDAFEMETACETAEIGEATATSSFESMESMTAEVEAEVAFEVEPEVEAEEIFDAEPEPEPEPVEFPFDRNCSFCDGLLEVPQPGQFQCPRCANLFEVSETGAVEDYHRLNPSILEIKSPCEREFLSNFKAMVGAMAKKNQLADGMRQELQAALERICDLLGEKAASPSETFQAVIVGNQDHLAIAIKTSKPVFGAANGSDDRLREAARYLDAMEVVPLPSKGELLKVSKRRK